MAKEVIRAKYENGVLRPLEPVDLKEGEVVELIIRRPPEDLFGALRRNPKVTKRDIEEVIEEVEAEGPL